MPSCAADLRELARGTSQDDERLYELDYEKAQVRLAVMACVDLRKFLMSTYSLVILSARIFRDIPVHIQVYMYMSIMALCTF